MTGELWSINRLATELRLDRRTVAGRLRDVPPAGQLRGKPAWRLADALPALRGDAPAKAEPTPPPGYEALARLPPADALALALAAEIVRAAPCVVAALAVDRGAAEASAGPALEAAALGALATVAADVLRAAGLSGDVLVRLVQAGPVPQARFDGFEGFDPRRAEALAGAVLAAHGNRCHQRRRAGSPG